MTEQGQALYDFEDACARELGTQRIIHELELTMERQ